MSYFRMLHIARYLEGLFVLIGILAPLQCLGGVHADPGR